MPGVSITDLVALETLQRVQDQFAMATGLAAILVDFRGKPVTSPSGFTDFCSTMREDAERRQECFNCDAHAGLQSAIRRAPHVYICHGGLVDFSIPLLVGDEYVGAMMCGQVRLPVDDPHSLPTLAVFGPSNLQPELAALRDKVPVMPITQVRAAASTLNDLMISLVASARAVSPDQAEGSSPGILPRLPAAMSAVPTPSIPPAEGGSRLDVVALRRAFTEEDMPRAVALVRQHLDAVFNPHDEAPQRRVSREVLRHGAQAIWGLARELDDTAAGEISLRITQERARPRPHATRFEAEEHLLGLVFCLYSTMEHSGARRAPTLNDLINRIEVHPTAFLTLQSAADFVALSPHHLSRTFKAHTGVTFIDYVTAKRIVRAQFLLRHTDEPVLRIAADLRFRPANYFSRAFKASTGLTPSEYRRRTPDQTRRAGREDHSMKDTA